MFETADVDMTTARCLCCAHLFFSFSYHPICPHVHMQRYVATVCASMGATVGRDPPSSVTVLQGSTAPAASMVSRNIFAVFHIHYLLFLLFFIYLCLILLLYSTRFLLVSLHYLSCVFLSATLKPFFSISVRIKLSSFCFY